MASIIQKLMQLTGKSSDEVMEALGKKAKTSVDDIDLGDITDPTIKRGRPAKSTIIDPNEIDLGKSPRKGLELDEAGGGTDVPVNQLDLEDVADINPNIDDLRLPTASPITERGLQGGGLPPVKPTETPDINLPATRGTTIPTEVGPEVIGKGTSRAGRESTEAIEAELVKKGMNPKLAKIAAISGLVGGGALMLGGGDNGGQQPPQIPFRPEEKSILPDNYMQLAQTEANEMDKVKTGTPKAESRLLGGDVDFDALSKKFDQGMAGLPKEEAPVEPVRDEMQEAIDRAERTELLAMLGKSASQIGSGIATIGAGQKIDVDSSGFDTLLKTAGSGISRVKEKQGFEKAKAELGDEKAMRDPKSEISRLVSDLAQKTGLIKPGQEVSAMSLKNSGVNLGTLLSTIEAGKARAEAARIARETKLEAKADKLDEQQRKFVQGLRKEATTGVLGKQYATYATGQRMAGSLEQFAKDPSGYKDYASLMGGLKSLQGDESVVREAEVRMGVGATSAINTALNYLDRLKSGKTLQPEQRQQMIDTIKILTEASKQQYLYSVQPILEQAQVEGIDPNLILSGSLSPKKAEKAQDNNSKEKTVVKKQYSASRNQTKLIFSDGSEEIVDGKQ